MKVPKARKLPSGNWFIQLRIGGQSVPITQPTEEKCEAMAMAVKAGLIETKESKAKDIPAPTFGEACDAYIKNRDSVLSPCTVRVYKSIRKNHLKKLVGKKIDAITKEDVQAAVNAESKNSSPKTVRNAYGLLTAVLSQYVTIDLSRVKLPQRENKERTALSKEQLEKLFEATAGTDIECQVLLASWLGLRRSEILALPWDAIGENTITIKQAMVPGTDGAMTIKKPKTETSARTITTDTALIDKINQLPKKGDLVFHMSANTMATRLSDACAKAGIPHIGWHALRHTNASIMLTIGIPDKYAMKRGGWANQSTMKYIYQHTMGAEESEYNGLVDSYFKDILLTKNANEK